MYAVGERNCNATSPLNAWKAVFYVYVHVIHFIFLIHVKKNCSSYSSFSESFKLSFCSESKVKLNDDKVDAIYAL